MTFVYVLPGVVSDVQIWTSYVKAIDHYRLTDRQIYTFRGWSKTANINVKKLSSLQRLLRTGRRPQTRRSKTANVTKNAIYYFAAQWHFCWCAGATQVISHFKNINFHLKLRNYIIVRSATSTVKFNAVRRDIKW